MPLLLATANKGKVIEMREALHSLGLELLSLQDIPAIGEPAETGDTYAENAKLKALHYHRDAAMPVVADDSGIEIAAIQNELGVQTRRWGAGAKASDEEWIEYFLNRMKNEKNKRARFVCSIAHIDHDGELHMFEGSCDGVITDTVEAPYLPGLPISGCFKPDGLDLVFSALPLSQKNAVGHRGRALMALREHLERA